MRTTTAAALAIIGIAAPLGVATAADAGLRDKVVAVAVAASPFASHTATPAASQPATARQTSSPATAAVLAVGSRGEQVTRLQARLAGAGLFSHQATGYYGQVTAQAVRAFQASHGLGATGTVDQATLDAISQLPLPAATAPKATASPSTTSPSSTSSKSASTSSATPRATTPAVSATMLDPRCTVGRVMCVDKTRQRLFWVVEGTVVDSFSTRTGRAGMDTREGQFSVYRMEKNSWSKLYQVHMPYAMYFDGGEAVHYSKDFATNGYGAGSHGCVNLRDRSGIAWLYGQVRLGDAVVVYRS